MEVKDLVIIEDCTIRQALQRLDTAAKKVLFVTRNEKLIGSVSDGDIRRWILKNGSLDETIMKIMNPNPICIKRSKCENVYEIMHKMGITAIPQVKESRQIEKIYTLDGEIDDMINEINLPVIIMAGGKGERLMPYTSILPKPLIPIGEKPIIERVIESFFHYGCKQFILTTNYRKAMLKAYFEEIDRDYKVFYIEESEPLGTGGGLWYLKNKIETPFFVSNCDIMLNIDYGEVLQFHTKNKNKITMITCLKQTILPYGVVELDKRDGKILRIREKPKSDYLINTGVYLLEPDILGLIEKKGYVQITDLIDKCIVEGYRVGAYPVSEECWMDMGQFESLEQMRLKLGV